MTHRNTKEKKMFIGPKVFLTCKAQKIGFSTNYSNLWAEMPITDFNCEGGVETAKLMILHFFKDLRSIFSELIG